MPSSMGPSNSNRIDLLDYGRFVAAISVLCFHYFYNGIQGGKVVTVTHLPYAVELGKYGYLGVEFFFMISGYVIFFSCKGRTAGEFLAARALRLYPAFWFAVLFTSFSACFWGGDPALVSLSKIMANLTMAAPYFGYAYVDGVYWTLLYELKFYLAVSVLLVLGLRGQIDRIFLAWPFAILVVQQMGWKGIPLSDGYYSFFAAGAVLAILKNRAGTLVWAAVIVGMWICIDFSVGKAAMLSSRKGVEHSALVVSAVMVLFFAIFLLANTVRGSNLRLIGAGMAGKLTYPVYLVHAYFGYMVLNEFATEANKAWVYMLTIAFVLAMGIFIHVVVEQKMRHVWRWIFHKGIETPVDSIRRKAITLYARNREQLS